MKKNNELKLLEIIERIYDEIQNLYTGLYPNEEQVQLRSLRYIIDNLHEELLDEEFYIQKGSFGYIVVDDEKSNPEWRNKPFKVVRV